MEINVKMYNSEYSIKTPDEDVEKADEFVEILTHLMRGMGWHPSSICKAMYYRGLGDAASLNIKLDSDETD